MRGRRAKLLMLCVLACAACGTKGARRSAEPSRALPTARGADAGQRFEAPGPDGWGHAGSLRYLERTLGGADAARALPLVVMIHGMGDAPTPDWFRGAGAIRTPMRLVMPRAPLPYYGGFSWFSYDVARQSPAQLAQGIAQAADALAHAIEVLRSQRPTRGRAIVAGFSQGGMLSYALALRHPELVEFSHPISGLLPEQLWPAKKPAGTRFPRIAAMHGDQDPLVPIDPARGLCAHLGRLGFDVSLREFAGVQHEVTDAMEAYTVELLDQAGRSLVEHAR